MAVYFVEHISHCMIAEIPLFLAFTVGLSLLAVLVLDEDQLIDIALSPGKIADLAGVGHHRDSSFLIHGALSIHPHHLYVNLIFVNFL